MKKFIATAWLMVSVCAAIACDVCGCAATGGNTMGIMPRFNRHFVGVRYSQTAYTSTHLTLFKNEVPKQSQEQFNTVQVWVGTFRTLVCSFLPLPRTIFLAGQKGEKLHTHKAWAMLLFWPTT